MVSRSSDIHADDVVLGVQTADKELLAVESRKERAQGVGSLALSREAESQGRTTGS